jgi:hypothetical protein
MIFLTPLRSIPSNRSLDVYDKHRWLNFIKSALKFWNGDNNAPAPVKTRFRGDQKIVVDKEHGSTCLLAENFVKDYDFDFLDL